MPVSAYGGVSAYAKLGGTRSEAAPERALAREGGERGATGIGEPLDEVELSPESLARGEEQEDAAGLLNGTAREEDGGDGGVERDGEPSTPGEREEGESETQRLAAEGEDEGPENSNELSEADKDVVRQLKDRDAEVRRHENAHASVGGQYAGSPQYEYQTGPDGKRYAVGGSVSIDISPVPGEPEKTIEKMRIVRAAALAPAEPSGQDRRVAAEATKTEASARSELAEQKAAEASDSGETEAAGEASAGGDSTDSSDSTSDAVAAPAPVAATRPTSAGTTPAGTTSASAAVGSPSGDGVAAPGTSREGGAATARSVAGEGVAASSLTGGVEASSAPTPSAEGVASTTANAGTPVDPGEVERSNPRMTSRGAGTMRLAAARRAASQYGQQASRASRGDTSPGSLLQATA